MKYLFSYIYFLIFMFNFGYIFAQTGAENTPKPENLVKNHSFEQITSCPTDFDELEKAKFWKRYQGTPELMHSCCKNGTTGVPNNFFGAQTAPTGGAYAGITTFHRTAPNEIIGGELTTPLQKGKRYRAGFKASLSEKYSGFSSNNMGILFTHNPEKDTKANKAHIKHDRILYQKNWTQVQGTFIADDNYTKFLLGNMFDNKNTILEREPASTDSSAYYYIDDVFVEEVFDPYAPKEPATITYINKITDEDTKKNINGKITYKTGENLQEMTFKEGEIRLELLKNKVYDLIITADGFYPIIEQIETNKLKNNTINAKLTPLKAGKTIVLNHIFFDFAKIVLKDASFVELNLLVQIMKQTPAIKIKIIGHTDNVGTDANNIILSKGRADAVRKYLIARGINEERLETQGAGKSMPVAPNTTEEGRTKNRRVAFTITL